MIDKTNIEGTWFYCLSHIESAIVKNAGPFQMDKIVPQVDGLVIRNGWISQKSLLKLLNWYADCAPTEYLYCIGQLERVIKEDLKKRTISRKKKWDIAYSQQYKCNHCKSLLIPNAFDIDHIVPLFKNGEDTLENCQALCCNCHSIKSRTER